MPNKVRDHEDFAEECFFKGMTRERFDQIAVLKPCKEFPKDVITALDSGGIRGLGDSGREFGCMAIELEKVIDIKLIEEQL